MCVTRIDGWGAYEHTYILLLLFIFPLTSLMRFAVAETLFPSITLRSLAAAAVIVVTTAAAAVSTVNEQSNPSRTGCWHTHWLSSIYKSICEKECECVWVCGCLCERVNVDCWGTRSPSSSLYKTVGNVWKQQNCCVVTKKHRRCYRPMYMITLCTCCYRDSALVGRLETLNFFDSK